MEGRASGPPVRKKPASGLNVAVYRRGGSGCYSHWAPADLRVLIRSRFLKRRLEIASRRLGARDCDRLKGVFINLYVDQDTLTALTGLFKDSAARAM
jgi:hypothetical protein